MIPKSEYILKLDVGNAIPDKSNEITIKGDVFFETIAQSDNSFLVRPVWISVKDKFPPQPEDITKVEYYWCALECKDCHLIPWQHTYSGFHQFIWCEELCSPIEYWMELPKPPN